MRNWNRLSLTLPLGLAVAALYVPLRLVWAGNSPPTAIQAALRVGPGETTPHFFTGDTQLSSFQRLPEPVQHPLQPTAVMDAASPNVEQRPVEQPRPGLAPAMINAVATVQVPPQQPLVQQPLPSNEPVARPPLGKPIAWDGEHQIDTHFFPNHSPLRFAAYIESGAQPNGPALANEAARGMPQLRAAEIVPVGTAHVAIAPPSQPQPWPQQQAIVPLPEPLPQAIGNPVVWDADQRTDAHFFPNHNPTHFAASFESARMPDQLTLGSQDTRLPPRLRSAEIQSVGTAQVAIAPAQPPPALALPPSPLPPQRPTPPTNANFASLPIGPPAERVAAVARPVSAAPRAGQPSQPRTIQPTIALAPELVEPTSAPPELTAPAAKTAAFENKRLAGPHFSLGPLRLASLERPTTNLQAPPLKEALVQSAAAPNLPPADLAAPPTAAAPAPQVVNLPTPIKPQLTSLETPSSSRLNPIALTPLPPLPNSVAPIEPELTSLITSGRQPFAPLIPTEVLPAASPPPLKEHFQLTALQPLPVPGVNLQPTEVLPIPSPYNPIAPRVPTAVDAERPIGAVSSRITNPSGRMPTDLAADRFRGEYPPYLPRDWEDSMYFWDAPTMCIGPLRYEEVNLERYGYSHCPAIQPVLSGMKFLGTTLALPYSIAARPFGTCQYPLGHYRPGSDVPFRHIRPELRPWPATVECMTIAGLILLIP